MDSFYGCVIFTIIALSGEAADAGLPGVRPGSRSRSEKPFTIRTHTVIASLDPIMKRYRDDFMGNSPWNLRAWTLQERIFSRRVLVFTAEQIYWEYQQASWCEDGIWEVSSSPRVFRRAFSPASFRLPWPSDQASLSNIYRLSLEKYTVRKLSYEHDTLKAFDRILHALKRTWVNDFFWGLPLFYLSSALLWETRRIFNIPIREANVGYEDEHGIMHSLHIPSWSWAAWETGISMANLGLGMAPEIIFHRMDSSGQLLEILESDEQPVQIDEEKNRLAWKNMAVSSLVVEDLPRSVVDHPARLTFLYFWSSSALLPIVWLTGYGKDLGPIMGSVDKPIRFSWMRLPDPPSAITQSVEDFGPGEMICTELQEFVVIGRDTHANVHGYSAMLKLILVEQREFIVYRRGLVSVAEEDWISASHDWNSSILG